MATPLTFEHLDRVGSTQDEARRRFEGNPLLITATGQDSGRGRSGAKWLDADRTLAASLAFDTDWAAVDRPRIALVAGLAIVEVLPTDVRLKWPNDIMRGVAKVGGILSEGSTGVVVIGLGLNVYWAVPPDGVAALHSKDPGADHARRIGEIWAENLLKRLEAGPNAWGSAEYSVRCSTIGKRITWHPRGTGVAVGISGDGALLVETDAGQVSLYSGAVNEIRQA